MLGVGLKGYATHASKMDLSPFQKAAAALAQKWFESEIEKNTSIAGVKDYGIDQFISKKILIPQASKVDNVTIS